MLASISPVGEASRRQRWWLTAGAYTVASAAAGTLLGAALGGVGQLTAVARSPGTALAALGAATLLGVALDLRRRGSLPSWRRQVDERWLGAYRGWVYGAGYGFQLGLGVATIVTASVTYAAFWGALLTGSWSRGAFVGLTFGLARSLPLLSAGRIRTAARLRRALAGLAAAERPVARLTTAVQAAVGVAAVALAVGVGTGAVT